MNQTSLPSPASSNPDRADASIGYVLVPPKQPPGLNPGIGSLVIAVAAPFVIVICFPVGIVFLFGAESPKYAAIAMAVIYGPAAACWLVAVICGLTCLRRAKHRDAHGHRTLAWMFGVFGLCITGIEMLAAVLVACLNP